MVKMPYYGSLAMAAGLTLLAGAQASSQDIYGSTWRHIQKSGSQTTYEIDGRKIPAKTLPLNPIGSQLIAFEMDGVRYLVDGRVAINMLNNQHRVTDIIDRAAKQGADVDGTIDAVVITEGKNPKRSVTLDDYSRGRYQGTYNMDVSIVNMQLGRQNPDPSKKPVK